MSIAELKKRREQMMNKLKAEKQGGGNRDERFWSPTFDKEKGTGRAVIRFLDAPLGEDLPYVKIFSHAFKGPTGKYYGELSLSTPGSPGGKDPVADLNSRLWNSGIESDKNVARGQKRVTKYISNVLVIEDPAHPENEGKVFLYRYGPMIHDLIQRRIFPDPDLKEYDDDGINIYDYWDGADFQIRIQSKDINGDKVPNYEKSTFKNPKPVFNDDDQIEELAQKCYSLKDFVSADKFKSEDELKKRLFEVLGPVVGSGIATVEGWGHAPERESAPAPRRESAAPASRAAEIDDFDTTTSVTQSSNDPDIDELMSLIK